MKDPIQHLFASSKNETSSCASIVLLKIWILIIWFSLSHWSLRWSVISESTPIDKASCHLILASLPPFSPAASLSISFWPLLKHRGALGAVIKDLFRRGKICQSGSLRSWPHLDGSRPWFTWDPSQDLKIEGIGRKTPDSSACKANQTLAFLWSANWGRRGDSYIHFI